MGTWSSAVRRRRQQEDAPTWLSSGELFTLWAERFHSNECSQLEHDMAMDRWLAGSGGYAHLTAWERRWIERHRRQEAADVEVDRKLAAACEEEAGLLDAVRTGKGVVDGPVADPRFMNSADAAKYLGCDYERLCELVRLSSFGFYIEDRRRVLFLRTELEAYVEGRGLRKVDRDEPL